ncbi:MAG: hypothetical protein MK085_02025 [Phycisphaerales bacterium]|nr:hypothetical protein [Phycisphaerales bacterium]
MSNVTLKTCDSRSLADGLRRMLMEEDIPALVERSPAPGKEQWCVRIPEAALEDAERVLANREAIGATINWEDVDVGEPSAEVQAELRRGPAVHAFATAIRWTGAILGLLILGSGLLGVILAVIG